MARQRRCFTAQEKVAIVRHRVLGKAPLPVLCAQFDIDAKLFYRWLGVVFCPFATGRPSPSEGEPAM
jgi:hypothetical protein